MLEYEGTGSRWRNGVSVNCGEICPNASTDLLAVLVGLVSLLMLVALRYCWEANTSMFNEQAGQWMIVDTT